MSIAGIYDRRKKKPRTMPGSGCLFEVSDFSVDFFYSGTIGRGIYPKTIVFAFALPNGFSSAFFDLLVGHPAFIGQKIGVECRGSYYRPKTLGFPFDNLFSVPAIGAAVYPLAIVQNFLPISVSADSARCAQDARHSHFPFSVVSVALWSL